MHHQTLISGICGKLLIFTCLNGIQLRQKYYRGIFGGALKITLA